LGSRRLAASGWDWPKGWGWVRGSRWVLAWERELELEQRCEPELELELEQGCEPELELEPAAPGCIR
jgi:hypothetical protein